MNRDESSYLSVPYEQKELGESGGENKNRNHMTASHVPLRGVCYGLTHNAIEQQLG